MGALDNFVGAKNPHTHNPILGAMSALKAQVLLFPKASAPLLSWMIWEVFLGISPPTPFMYLTLWDTQDRQVRLGGICKTRPDLP